MIKRILLHLRNYNDGRIGTTVHMDLVWCLFTILISSFAAYAINTNLIGVGDPFKLALLAGMVHAVIYLQVITLVVLALSYISPLIKCYRAVIVSFMPILIYLVIRVITDPEPVAVTYTYGATIAAVGITFYKLKAIGCYLLTVTQVSRKLETHN